MWQYFVILAALYMVGVAIYDMVILENNNNAMIVNGVNMCIGGGLLVFAFNSLYKKTGSSGHGHGDKDKGRDKGRDNRPQNQGQKIGGKR